MNRWDSHNSDINQRRQFSIRISELKSDCEQLIKTRDELSSRLNELNKVADQLINEKRSSKPASAGFKQFLPSIQMRMTSSPKQLLQPIRSSKSYHSGFSSLPTTDLNLHNHSSSSSLSSDYQRKQPSDAFRLKLYHCLRDLVPKAEEIAKLTDLYIKYKDDS